MSEPRITTQALIDAYGRLRRKLGRAPTTGQLAREVGYACGGSVKKRMERLGYTFSPPMSRQERGRRAARALRGDEDESAESAEAAVRKKLRAIRGPREARREDGLTRAGWEHPPGAVIRATCAVCGKPFVMRPRTWPFFVRSADGSPQWLCGEACSGFITFGG